MQNNISLHLSYDSCIYISPCQTMGVYRAKHSHLIISNKLKDLIAKTFSEYID